MASVGKFKLATDRRAGSGARLPSRDKIGFYGCCGRVVRVATAKPTSRPPASKKIECPACERTHLVEPMWRNRKDDEREQPEALI